MQHFAVVAQGDGFYGCSLFTLPESERGRVEELLEAEDVAGALGFEGTVLTEPCPFACPEPHTLFDTGSGPEELDFLRKLKARLSAP